MHTKSLVSRLGLKLVCLLAWAWAAGLQAGAADAPAPPAAPDASGDVNLARAPGTESFGNSSSGPFIFTKINDGRFDLMGMWSTTGEAGSFAGVKLGDAPVTFNTVQFYLFNKRGTFTGWRIEGTDDCDIDDDSRKGDFYDPELIATDPDTAFTNSDSTEKSTVTISFKPASYKFMRLLFPNKSPQVGIFEIEVYDRANPGAASSATITGSTYPVDSEKNTLTIPGPLAVSALLASLTAPAGAKLTAYDVDGKALQPTDTMKNNGFVLSMVQTGGGAAPFDTQEMIYTVIDSSAPPPPPKPPKPPRPPKPPKAPTMPASIPPATDASNLAVGKTWIGSINTVRLDDFAKSGAGNWFAGQHFPQWMAVDFGTPTEFNYIAMNAIQVPHSCLQTSDDGTTWKTLTEITNLRKPWLWNGYFDKTTARFVRLIVLPPSWDVHLHGFSVSDLATPPTGADGKPAAPIAPPATPVDGLDKLPPVIAPGTPMAR